MGVGPGLWEYLSAVKKEESLSFLRDKRLAIDLSYWLVQQQQALKDKRVRKPHLRLTFFRVVNLVARVGARPVFVVDGEPPPLKKATREKRSKQSSHAWAKDFSSGWETSSQDTFKDKVEECVVMSAISKSGKTQNSSNQATLMPMVMLEYLGIPVIRGEGEAESLCAELNRKGVVDACVTPDSDAFVHGAKSVIKNLQADPKDPLVELYQAADIEGKLGLHQRHLLALALLVGCDYTEGVYGVGFESALRLIRCSSDDEILDRLRAWGKGELPKQAEINQPCDTDENQVIIKYTHCSKCGHLGNKGVHKKFGCQTCTGLTDEEWTSADLTILDCKEKTKGFKCACHVCIKKSDQTEKTRSITWWRKICCKMATTPGFPDEKIIDIFLKPDNRDFERHTYIMAQQRPNMEKLEGFLGEKLFWDATYIRCKTLPLLSHFCLVELAARNSGALIHNRPTVLINDLYRPCSIERVKIDCSEPLFVLKWEAVDNSGAENAEQWLGMESSQAPKLRKLKKVLFSDIESQAFEKDYWSFTTNENIALVRAACPDLAKTYDEAQVAKQENLKKSVKRKRVEAGKDGGKQSSILSYDHSEHTPDSEMGSKPQEFVSSVLSLDRPSPASLRSDVMDESHASFKLGTNFKYQPGLSLDTPSPRPVSPEKMPRRKAVSRKLTFVADTV